MARQQSFVFERDIYLQPEIIYLQIPIGPAYLVLIALAAKGGILKWFSKR